LEPVKCKDTESQEKKLNSRADTNQESGINNQKKVIEGTVRNDSTSTKASHLSEKSGKTGIDSDRNEKELNETRISEERETQDTPAKSTVTGNNANTYIRASIKRKQNYDMQHRATKIPRQSRKSNWQALLSRQHSYLRRNQTNSIYNIYDSNQENTRLDHGENYRAERLCPEFNTPWGCRYPQWACPYIHDYADDIHF
jgi:hypothetical protein